MFKVILENPDYVLQKGLSPPTCLGWKSVTTSWSPWVDCLGELRLRLWVVEMWWLSSLWMLRGLTLVPGVLRNWVANRIFKTILQIYYVNCYHMMSGIDLRTHEGPNPESPRLWWWAKPNSAPSWNQSWWQRLPGCSSLEAWWCFWPSRPDVNMMELSTDSLFFVAGTGYEREVCFRISDFKMEKCEFQVRPILSLLWLNCSPVFPVFMVNSPPSKWNHTWIYWKRKGWPLGTGQMTIFGW